MALFKESDQDPSMYVYTYVRMFMGRLSCEDQESSQLSP